MRIKSALPAKKEEGEEEEEECAVAGRSSSAGMEEGGRRTWRGTAPLCVRAQHCFCSVWGTPVILVSLVCKLFVLMPDSENMSENVKTRRLPVDLIRYS